MKITAHKLIEKTARDFCLELHDSPFHAGEGIELRKRTSNSDVIICIGYIRGPRQTAIYRRLESIRDLFYRNKLWFLYGWLIKPRPRENHYQVLKELPSAEFDEEIFIDIVNEIVKGSVLGIEN